MLGGSTRDLFSRSVFDALQIGVLVLDSNDQLLLANSAARRLGILHQAPMGHGSDQADTVVLALVRQVRGNGGVAQVELDLPRNDDDDLAHDDKTVVSHEGLRGVNIRAVVLEGGNVVVEAADITEAHRLAKMRRDFVANVSHELKTPVGALRLLGEALIEATEPLDDEVGQDPSLADITAIRLFSKRIRHESIRLSRLVSDLLELTRLQSADSVTQSEPVSVDCVVAEVVDRNRTPSMAKSITIMVDGDRGAVVYGIENQLLTAISNLVENAIAYSPENTQVTITINNARKAVKIIVSDQGIGIERKDLERIFERFYRSDKARSRVTGGTGLGLAIVKHIVTNHGGRVEVDSVVGRGSTFTLRLPTSPVEAVSSITASREV